jgi:hypothetical protein
MNLRVLSTTPPFGTPRMGFRLCWEGCPCQETGQWMWPSEVCGDSLHPDVASFIAVHVIERWAKMGVRFVDLSLRKPKPSLHGAPLLERFVVARALTHAIRRGERYDRHEVEASEIFA